MIRVVHVLQDGHTDFTAQARCLKPVIRAGIDRGYSHEVWLLGGDGPIGEELREAGAPVRALGWRRGIRDPVGLIRFAAALRTRGFDILHQHSGGRSIRWAARRAGVRRICLHLHAYVTEGPGSVEFLPLDIRDANVVVTNSHATAARVTTAVPRVIHCGFELPPVALRSDDPPPVIGAAGRLVPVKGFRDLLGAFRRIHQWLPEARLEIAGEGPERSALEREAERLGIAQHTRFLGWRADLGEAYRGWAVFAQPSLAEGFGMAAADAMAAGLPVVASAVGGLVELVLPDETGVLVPPGRPDLLAQALRRILEAPSEASALGERGRHRIAAHFSTEAMVRRVYDQYAELLEVTRDTAACDTP